MHTSTVLKRSYVVSLVFLAVNSQNSFRLPDNVKFNMTSGRLFLMCGGGGTEPCYLDTHFCDMMKTASNRRGQCHECALLCRKENIYEDLDNLKYSNCRVNCKVFIWKQREEKKKKDLEKEKNLTLTAEISNTKLNMEKASNLTNQQSNYEESCWWKENKALFVAVFLTAVVFICLTVVVLKWKNVFCRKTRSQQDEEAGCRRMTEKVQHTALLKSCTGCYSERSLSHPVDESQEDTSMVPGGLLQHPTDS